MMHWMQDRKPLIPQAFLRDGGTLAQLEAKGINIKRHPRYSNLVQLKYGKIDADFNDPLVRQCRGLILDEYYNWSCIARPFDKFGNWGESYAAEIDWATATVQEKLDGSLMIMYCYDQAWHVATSGTPDGGGEVNGYGMKFAELFWDVWKSHKYTMPSVMQENLTFMFELTTPYNRVVVKHSGCDIRLIGVRNRFTGEEQPVRNHAMWHRVREFPPARSLEHLMQDFKDMDPAQQEGFVVVDKDFNRIKVKHPGYVVLHHMRDNLTPKGILEVIRAGEWQEVVATFPEWKEVFEQVAARYDGLAITLDQNYEEIKDIEPRKAYAEEAKKSIMPAVLFMLKDGKVQSAKEALQMMQIDRLMAVLSIEMFQPLMVGL
jgi:hypothetical protein